MVLSESSYGERMIGIDVGICALFGGYTVLSTKALSSLLSTIFLNLLRKPIGWLLVAVLIGTSIMQVKYLNRALMRFESKVCPFNSSRKRTHAAALARGSLDSGGHPDAIRLLLSLR